MGLAITYQIRDQQSYGYESTDKFDLSNLPEDLREDYYNAPPEARSRLLKKWGLVKAG
jgi:hypothetical protein